MSRQDERDFLQAIEAVFVAILDATKDVLCFLLVLVAAVVPWRTIQVFASAFGAPSRQEYRKRAVWLCLYSLFDVLAVPAGVLAFLCPWRTAQAARAVRKLLAKAPPANDDDVDKDCRYNWKLRFLFLVQFFAALFDGPIILSSLFILLIPWRTGPFIRCVRNKWDEEWDGTWSCYSMSLRLSAVRQVFLALADVPLLLLGLLPLAVPWRAYQAFRVYRHRLAQPEEGEGGWWSAAVVAIDVVAVPAGLLALLSGWRTAPFIASILNCDQNAELYSEDRPQDERFNGELRWEALVHFLWLFVDVVPVLCALVCLATGIRAGPLIAELAHHWRSLDSEERRRMVERHGHRIAAKNFAQLLLDLALLLQAALLLVTLWRFYAFAVELYALWSSKTWEERLRIQFEFDALAIASKQVGVLALDVAFLPMALLVFATAWRAPALLAAYRAAASPLDKRLACVKQFLWLLVDVPFALLYLATLAMLWRAWPCSRELAPHWRREGGPSWDARLVVLEHFFLTFWDVPFILMAGVVFCTLWRALPLGQVVFDRESSSYWNRRASFEQFALLLRDLAAAALLLPFVLLTVYRVPSFLFTLLKGGRRAVDEPLLVPRESLSVSLRGPDSGGVEMHVAIRGPSAAGLAERLRGPSPPRLALHVQGDGFWERAVAAMGAAGVAIVRGMLPLVVRPPEQVSVVSSADEGEGGEPPGVTVRIVLHASFKRRVLGKIFRKIVRVAGDETLEFVAEIEGPAGTEGALFLLPAAASKIAESIEKNLPIETTGERPAVVERAARLQDRLFPATLRELLVIAQDAWAALKVLGVLGLAALTHLAPWRALGMYIALLEPVERFPKRVCVSLLGRWATVQREDLARFGAETEAALAARLKEAAAGEGAGGGPDPWAPGGNELAAERALREACDTFHRAEKGSRAWRRALVHTRLATRLLDGAGEPGRRAKALMAEEWGLWNGRRLAAYEHAQAEAFVATAAAADWEEAGEVPLAGALPLLRAEAAAARAENLGSLAECVGRVDGEKARLEGELRGPWNGPCGLFRRPWRETRKVIFGSFAEAAQDLIAIFFLALLVATVYRLVLAVRDFFAARGAVRKRGALQAQVREVALDLLYLLKSLLVLVLLYRSLDFLAEVTQEGLARGSAAGCRGVVDRYLRAMARDLGRLWQLLTLWDLYRVLVSAALWGVLMPMEALTEVSSVLFCGMSRRNAIPHSALVYLAMLGIAVAIPWGVLPASYPGQAALAGVPALVGLSAACVALAGLADRELRPVADPSPRVRWTAANARAALGLLVEFAQGCAMPVLLVGGAALVPAELASGLGRGIDAAASIPFFSFGDGHEFSRGLPLAPFFAAVVALGAWYFLAAAPVVVETLLKLAPPGAVARSPAWLAAVTFFADPFLLTLAGNLAKPLGCAPDAAGLLRLAADPRVACWTDLTHRRMAAGAAAALLFLALTLVVLVTRAGRDGRSDDDCDLRLAPAFLATTAGAKTLLATVAFAFVEGPRLTSTLGFLAAGYAALSVFSLAYGRAAGAPAASPPWLAHAKAASYAGSAWIAAVCLVATRGIEPGWYLLAMLLVGWGVLALAALLAACLARFRGGGAAARTPADDVAEAMLALEERLWIGRGEPAGPAPPPPSPSSRPPPGLAPPARLGRQARRLAASRGRGAAAETLARELAALEEAVAFEAAGLAWWRRGRGLWRACLLGRHGAGKGVGDGGGEAPATAAALLPLVRELDAGLLAPAVGGAAEGEEAWGTRRIGPSPPAARPARPAAAARAPPCRPAGARASRDLAGRREVAPASARAQRSSLETEAAAEEAERKRRGWAVLQAADASDARLDGPRFLPGAGGAAWGRRDEPAAVGRLTAHRYESWVNVAGHRLSVPLSFRALVELPAPPPRGAGGAAGGAGGQPLAFAASLLVPLRSGAYRRLRLDPAPCHEEEAPAPAPPRPRPRPSHPRRRRRRRRGGVGAGLGAGERGGRARRTGRGEGPAEGHLRGPAGGAALALRPLRGPRGGPAPAPAAPAAPAGGVVAGPELLAGLLRAGSVAEGGGAEGDPEEPTAGRPYLAELAVRDEQHAAWLAAGAAGAAAPGSSTAGAARWTAHFALHLRSLRLAGAEEAEAEAERRRAEHLIEVRVPSPRRPSGESARASAEPEAEAADAGPAPPTPAAAAGPAEEEPEGVPEEPAKADVDSGAAGRGSPREEPSLPAASPRSPAAAPAEADPEEALAGAPRAKLPGEATSP
eukprot:tig00000093_g3624.t1